MLGRIVEHVRTPLYREGYALVLSAALASLLGFAYWILAAHTYDPADVGINSAAISAMTLISAFAQLNFLGALVRFVPWAGRTTWRLVGWSYGVSLVISALVGAIFLAGVRTWTPRLSFLVSDEGWVLWFVGATMLWSLFGLQDAVLTGLRRAVWVPVDNTLFGLVKIGLLAALTGMLPRFGIFVSWTLGAAIAVAVISVALVRLIAVYVTASGEAGEPPTARAISRFATADFVGGLSWTAAITLIPIVITQRLGAAQNAFYYLPWVMVMPLYLVSASTSSSLVVALVRDGVRDYASRVTVQTARLVVPGSIGLALAAPLLLSVFGEQYRREGTTTLRLLALSAIPNMVSALYTGVWRAERRLSLLAWVRVVEYGSVVLLSIALLRPYGIVGPAIAWLAVQTVVAGLLVVRYPGTLADESAGPRWELQLIILARNAAERSGVLGLLQAAKRMPVARRRHARALEVVPRLLSRLPKASETPPPSTWTALEPLDSVTDTIVMLVGPAAGPRHAAIKLADSGQGRRSLAREIETLGRLAADARLAALRPLFPRILAAGEIDGSPYLVESVLPGITAARLLGGGVAGDALLAPLAEPVTSLHRLSAEWIEVGEEALERWVELPLAVLEAHVRRDGATAGWRGRALDRLRFELRGALFGRTVATGWTHGDYVPGNLLVDPATLEVTGILDWELAANPGLPPLDLVQLVLAGRAIERRREPGEVVRGALGDDWTESERAVLGLASESFASGGAPLRELVLMAWLWHTAGMLTKAECYADNWLWTKANLEAALAMLA